ncbi:AAA family ATPase [Laspinema sp. A4]|uniref:AAA family ATPase n=1 Tax=Laspinema sp. D2d TaxID=2953686 RepID=UPI0021BA940C|nr:AAA family ATPase [Laspinema sp. D2d]MCT7984892.1 AAA family ATPase [Laspinema sp. D2d]
MIELSGYQIAEEIYRNSKRVVYRGMREADGLPVILKALGTEYPSPTDIVQLHHEYEITKALKLGGIIEPLSVEKSSNLPILILPDIGGVSLKIFLNKHRLGIDNFLKLGIQLAQTLGEIHQHHIIHKDIKPSNIIIQPESLEVKLIDFAIASKLSKETAAAVHPNSLEGTLAYMSPEQTGRMNRAIDYRTDFYSLGVTFYEMLIGELPCQAEDAVELVHCHIARMPVPPTELIPEIPVAVSNLVMKLLSKNAENRYQSGFGLKRDLEICLKQWQEKGKIDEFSLGQQDVSGKLEIPQKLYGRDRELAQLLVAFERVCGGAAELILVAGYSGVGKSALVQETQKPLVKHRGYFISGKFDQFKRNIPYDSLIQAFQSLIRQIFTENEAQIQGWKEKLLAALGPNGQAIVDVIPTVEFIIGKQPPLPELGPTESQNRFTQVFKQFISVFTRKKHPLVIFLDDLQWADSASLKLIEGLMSDADSEYLLLIGAYRDNEVSAIHPLIQTLETLKKVGAAVKQIILEPLQLIHVEELVRDTLNQSIESKELAKLLFNQAGGNPFFLTQLLTTIYRESLLSYDWKTQKWQWDINHIQAVGISDYNVVDLMIRNICRLPQATQKVLTLAACIGNTFNLELLAIVNEEIISITAHQLQPAIESGLIFLLNHDYKSLFLLSQSQAPDSTLKDIKLDYKFLHDRVQQAAYALIPEEQKKQTHLKLGKLLLQSTSEEEQKDNIFSLVNQLNHGADLLKSPAEKYQLAALNLIAGQKAKAATAFESASKYFHLGLGLLTENCWDRQYHLTLALHEEAAEAALLNGHFEVMEALAEVVGTHANTLLDTLKINELRLKSCEMQGELLKGVKLGLQILKGLGIELSESPTPAEVEEALITTRATLNEESLAQLLDMFLVEDETKQAILQLITTLVPAAFLSAPSVFILLVCQHVNCSYKFGNSAYSACGFADYGIILIGVMQDIQLGYQFGQLALNLLKRLDIKEVKTATLFKVASFTIHWKHHLKETLGLLSEAYCSGLEYGDVANAGYSASHRCQHLYWMGVELNTLKEEMATYSKAIIKINQKTAFKWHQPFYQGVLNLMGEAENPCQLIGTAYNESYWLPLHIQANERTVLHYIFLNKLILCYLFYQFEEAIKNGNQAEEYLDGVTGWMAVPVFYFYHSLAQLSVYLGHGESEQVLILERIQANQEKMKTWADHAPANFQHKYQLVEAEKARVMGHKEEAIDYYEQAIQGAKAQGYIQEEALGNELAGKFQLALGRQKIAKTYLTDAYYCYIHWGAKAKVKNLEERYPQLLTPDLKQLLNIPIFETNTSASTTESSLLDLESVMKAAQTISGEIILPQLLENLMKILIENAGAETGVLILSQADKWVIEASGNKQELRVRQSIPLSESLDVPISVIQYVKRTQNDVILADAREEELFRGDRYILESQPKSILCCPILSQGKLIGILYLENNLITNAFTPKRVEVLRMLSAQAALSLENAQLYEAQKEYSRKLEQTVQERTQELQQSNTRYYNLAANIPGMIYQLMMHPDGTSSCPYVSPGSREIFGIEAEAFMKDISLFHEVTHPDDREKFSESIALSATTLEPWHWTWRIIVSGEIKWVQGDSRPEKQPDGSIIWDGLVIDITARKEAEKELRTSEERWQLALKGTNDGIWDWNVQTNEVFFSARWKEMIGYEDYEIVNHTDEFFKKLHPDDRDWVWQALQDHIKGKTLYYSAEFRFQCKNGTYKWMLSRAQVLWDELGNPVRLVGSHTDITDRKQREEALELIVLGTASVIGSAFFKSLVQSLAQVSQARYAVLAETDLTLHKAQTLAFWTGEDFGQNFEYNLAGTACECVIQNQASYYTAQVQQLFPNNPDLKALGVEAYWGTPLYNSTGKIIGILSILDERPIEKNYLLESILKIFAARAGAELERQQAQSKLNAAKEAADAASKAKGEFLSKMSHELRTPLNAILGFTQILNRDNSLKSQQQDYLGIISRAGEHLLTLINDVLEMSKIEAGRISLNETSFDLYCLLTSIEEMFQLKAESQGLKLMFERTPNLPQFIKTDESKLRQVFINLLGNAIKFTEKGGVAVRVAIQQKISAIGEKTSEPYPSQPEELESYLVCEIEDTGPGISAEELDSLFEPFMQTATGIKSQSGTGLGLPISRQFVQLMGGEITVSSTLEKGTIFKFNLKISPAEGMSEITQKSSQRVIGLAANQPTYRILVVEDKWESRLLLVNLLSPLGFEVREAMNGAEAVRISQSWQPHLIWMDMQMPVMDGYEATKQIKQANSGQIPVIIGLTASAFEENRIKVLEVGCDDFASKPFREPVIFEKMAEHLGVHYVYEEVRSSDGNNAQPSVQSEAAVIAECLQQMSPEWTTQLHQAARELDDEAIANLTAQIPDSNHALANQITNFVTHLRFDKIIELIESNEPLYKS